MLCVAVMLSVMVMGAGAAFSDQDKIENTERQYVHCAEHYWRVRMVPHHPERNIERSEITKDDLRGPQRRQGA